MKLTKYDRVTLEDVNIDGAKDVKIRWLIAEEDGAPNFAMRMFEVQPGGHTPYHTHDWEHEIFVLEGEGELKTEKGTQNFAAGDIIFVDPNMHHNFTNRGDKLMRFLCLVPHQNKQTKPKKKVNTNPFAGGRANNC